MSDVLLMHKLLSYNLLMVAAATKKGAVVVSEKWCLIREEGLCAQLGT